MPVEALPPLDAVVLSHYHGDHFDRVAALGLDHELPVITEPHAARKLARRYPPPLAGTGQHALGPDGVGGGAGTAGGGPGARTTGTAWRGIDCCVIHLGGTKLAGVLLTMDARQGIEALRIVAPRVALPVHYDDYGLFTSPLSDFVALVAGAGPVSDVVRLARGETFRRALARAA
jgi:L-ascorbate metabolism protein UlaG (beta-lactamase superfamily)